MCAMASMTLSQDAADFIHDDRLTALTHTTEDAAAVRDVIAKSLAKQLAPDNVRVLTVAPAESLTSPSSVKSIFVAPLFFCRKRRIARFRASSRLITRSFIYNVCPSGSEPGGVNVYSIVRPVSGFV